MQRCSKREAEIKTIAAEADAKAIEHRARGEAKAIALNNLKLLALFTVRSVNLSEIAVAMQDDVQIALDINVSGDFFQALNLIFPV